MKIRCITNHGNELPDHYLDTQAGLTANSIFPVTIGKVYIVYGISFRKDQVFYCICDDDYEAMDGLYYPNFWPSPIFDIENSKVSRYWRFGFTPDHRDHLAIISYDEWINDPYYYDRLTDREEKGTIQFLRYKALIDNEDE